VVLPTRIGPHDLWKSITTFSIISLIRAPIENRGAGADKMSNEVAAITQAAYSAADRVAFKAEGVLLWMDAVCHLPNNRMVGRTDVKSYLEAASRHAIDSVEAQRGSEVAVGRRKVRP
jgi:hypothetical protein